MQQGELYGDRVGNLMEERFNQINNISKIDGLFIADKNNIITHNKVSEGQRSFVNIDISLRDYVNETKSNLKPVFSNGFKGIDGTYKIALTSPIINRDNKEYSEWSEWKYHLLISLHDMEMYITSIQNFW